MATSNGLPYQTAKVTQPATRMVEDNSVWNMISGLPDVVAKSAESLTPLADAFFRYQLTAKTIKNQNATNLDGSTDSSLTGLTGGDNRTLLIIAGLAALGVAVVLIAK